MQHKWQLMGLMAILVCAGATGCASQDKERIAMLEQANRNLTDRYNRLHGETQAERQAREDMAHQLAAARAESEELRRRLAEAPTPEQAAPGWTAVPGGAMIAIEGSVLFSPGKNTLRDESRRTLDAVVSTLQGQYGDKDILVFGHTDDRPIKKSGWTDNWELSSQRSLAVVRYLKERGVTPKRLVSSACGEFRPRASNNTEANRAANRRVEIFAVDPSLRLGQP